MSTVVQNLGSVGEQKWVWVTVLPLTRCVGLRRLPNPSEPQFAICSVGLIGLPTSQGCYEQERKWNVLSTMCDTPSKCLINGDCYCCYNRYWFQWVLQLCFDRGQSLVNLGRREQGNFSLEPLLYNSFQQWLDLVHLYIPRAQASVPARAGTEYKVKNLNWVCKHCFTLIWEVFS